MRCRILSVLLAADDPGNALSTGSLSIGSSLWSNMGLTLRRRPLHRSSEAALFPLGMIIHIHGVLLISLAFQFDHSWTLEIRFRDLYKRFH